MQVFVKLLKDLPVHEIIFFRAFFAFIFCLFFMLKNKLKIFGTNKKLLFLRGFFGTLALFCFFSTIHHMPLANASVIHYLSPLFTSFFSIFFLKEKLKPIQWSFFILSFIGIFLIKGFDERVPLLYFTLGVVSALFAGLAYNCIGKLKQSEHPLVIIFYFPLVTLPFITPYTIMNWVDPLPLQWLYLLGVGICVQIAQYFMTLAYQVGKVSSLSLYNNLGPLFAVFFGLIIFNESLLLIQFFGISLVLLGVYLNTKEEGKN